MSKTIEIPGTLSSTSGDIRVGLSVRTAQLLGQHELEDENIVPGSMKLTTDGIPDGDYVLEFSYNGPHREYVRVKNGMLMGR